MVPKKSEKFDLVWLYWQQQEKCVISNGTEEVSRYLTKVYYLTSTPPLCYSFFG